MAVPPGTVESVEAYAKAVDKVIELMVKELRRLLRTGVRGEALARVGAPVVRRAMLEVWAHGCKLLDAQAKAYTGNLAYLPRPPWYTTTQFAHTIKKNGGKLTEQGIENLVRDVEWQTRMVARDTLRRASEDPLPKPRAKPTKQQVESAKDPGDGHDLNKDAEAITDPVDTGKSERGDWINELADELAAIRRQGADTILEGEDWDPQDEYDEAKRKTAKRTDGGKARRIVAWARVIRGEYTCPFCLMLASRGAIYRTKKSASVKARSKLEAGALDGSYHYHCDCVVVPVYSKTDWVGKEQADYLSSLWKKHANGNLEEWSEAVRELVKNDKLKLEDVTPLAADAQ